MKLSERRMQALSLIDIQNVSLDILTEVHQFCKANDIQYSLAYGTLLGAIRHKGFIPWDDDIDIFMTRPNYEKFARLFKPQEGIAFISEKDSYIALPRVCDVKRTVFQSTLPWAPNKDLGIWIDIFPIDGVEDDRAAFKKRMIENARLYNLQLAVRRAMPNLSTKLSLRQNIKQLCRKIRYFNWTPRKINDKILDQCKEYPFATASHCSQLVSTTTLDKQFYDKKIFDEYTEVEFEGRMFSAIRDWDTILKLNYGSYMQLPPEEERVQHSSDHTKFYWKE